MRTSFISLILLLLLGACSRPEVTERLAHAERIMNAHPDSALQLLRAIDAPHKLRGKERADYAWLLTQAYDKNYLDSLQSDSLIALATDYYADNADAVRAGKAFFYQGKVLALQGKDSLAMVSYLEAGRRLENTDEHQMNARTQEYIGHLYKDNDLDAKALVYYRKAIPYYTMINDSLGLAHSYTSIAKLFYNKQDYDSLYKYANMAIEFINHDSTKMPFSSLMKLLGDVERRKKNYQKATSYYESAIRSCRYAGNLPSYYISLGEVCLATNNLKQAESYFIKITTLPNVNKWSLAGANHYLYLINKKQHKYQQALLYKEKSDSLLNIYNQGIKNTELLKIQQQFKAEKLQIEKELLEQQKKNQLFIGIIILLSVTVLSIIIYLKYKVQVSKNEQLVKDISELQLFIEKKNIEKVAQVTQLFKEQFKTINMFCDSFFAYNNLPHNHNLRNKVYQQVETIIEQFSHDENKMAELEQMIDFYYNNIMKELRQALLLSEKERKQLCYHIAGFSINNISLFMEETTDSIYKRRGRTRAKIASSNFSQKDFLLGFLA